MRTLIVAHGNPPSERLLATLRAEADLVIATDGAAEFLHNLGITPNVILGDFDSLTPEFLNQMPGDIVQPAPNQDASDLDKAIEWALQHGACRITITGATGGRVDHTLTNMSILMKYAGHAVRIVEDWGEAQIITGEATIQGTPGDTLSLVLFAPVKGVSLTGVRWVLHDEDLAPGSRGVSNEFTETAAHIRVREGAVFSVHLYRDPQDRIL